MLSGLQWEERSGHLTSQSLAAYPLARCNDNSSAAYFFAPSVKGSALWVVYLQVFPPAAALHTPRHAPRHATLWPDSPLCLAQGGMWCWSAASCAQRFAAAPEEMGSGRWPTNLTLGGIFSAPLSGALNPWADANKAYLGYCSSDAWVGDAPPSVATGGFAFRGQAIVRAALADMAARHGLSASSSVLFGGCSAGGRGAMFTLDAVAAMLPAGSTVKGLLDSPLWLDEQPLDASETSLQEQTVGVLGLVNASGRIPADCAAAYPGDELWKCLYGQYVTSRRAVRARGLGAGR
jgi:hypothetical protein